MNDEMEHEVLAPSAVAVVGGRLRKRRRPGAATLGRLLAGALLALCVTNLTAAAKAESRATAGDWSRVAEKAVVEATWTTEHAPLQSESPMPPVAPFGQEWPTLQAQVPYGQVCRLGYWYCYLPAPAPIGAPCWCAATPIRPAFEGVVVLY